MSPIIFRNLAHDIVWALLALSASLAILAPSVASLSGDFEFVRGASSVLAITLLPSVGVWSVFWFTGRKPKAPRALYYQAVATSLTMVMLYVVDRSSGVLGSEIRLVVLGLGVFAGLKSAEFLFAKYRRVIPGVLKRVLIVGDGPLAVQMEEFMHANRESYVMLGRVSCTSTVFPPADEEAGHETAPGRIGRLLRLAQNFGADKVVVALAERRGFFPVEELLNCKMAGIEVVDAPSFYESATHKLLIENISPSWFIFSHGFKVNWVLRLCKRIFDLSAASVGLICFMPFVPFIALAIKLDSPGPMLFRQVRVGRGDRPFVLMKFRTMREDAEAGTGAVWSQVDDPRITKVGNFLRRSRLDEIPQLINILKGDMSLVGPRPERPEFVSELKEVIPYYSERHYVKPGLTGWAQVLYPYGSTVEDAIEKLRYDMYYIKNISIILDLYIVIKTFKVVLLGKGR
ncbi:MAG: TIGR03013 family PEP-CTERM/XrtA system glycosyltransferase [Proteobacteria bacterium]|jgi:sugar transferase (PEP-CTERM system associated)|nr:TIGR03013 family PEP-CTERM/XrtA system glycosyltransferase [Pseudomonadota bacterium]